MGSRHAVPLRLLLVLLPLLPFITTCTTDPASLAVPNRVGSLQSHFVANLLTNPGFEAGGQDWQNASAPGRAVDNLRIHDGAAAERITASALQEFAVFQERSVIAESSYTASGWITTEGLDGAHAVLEVLWLTGSGLSDSIPSAELIGSDQVGQLEGTTDWTFVSRSVTVPAGAAVARFQLRLELEPDDVGTAWFDDDTLSGPEALDDTPPTVMITSPQAGSTIEGIVTITASATDEGPVAGVQFQVNGVNLGSEITSPPYQIDLDTHTLSNGPADLTAAARDTAGNDTVSAPVQVTVFNQPRLPMNIVLILTDDQRASTMAQMPLTMSLIGNPGVRFVNAFATTPLCCPARATILTGLYTHNHNVRSNAPPYGAPAFADGSTIATWLQAAGYRTALIGKYMNMYDKKTPWPYQPPGWSYWSAFKVPNYYSYRLVENRKEVVYGSTTADYSTKVIARKAVAFIDSTPPSQPLLLYFAPFAPHEPATPASSDQTLFSTLAKWRPPAFNEADVSDKPLWIQRLPLLTSTQIKTQDAFRLKQLRSLAAVDRGVRDIVNALIRTGRMSNTAIVFASDNGLSWGEHRWRFKDCVYDECIRIPFLVLAPGIAPRVDSSFVALTDLAPTFAEWAGVSPPVSVNGVSLVGLLANPGRPWRQELLIEVLEHAEKNANEGLFSGVRTHRYAYAEHTTGEVELYDMKVDPSQLTNIAGDPANAGVIAQLSSLVASLKSQ